MTPDQKAIIRTLLYFDIFSYPLNKTELYELLCLNSDILQFELDLDFLLKKNLIGSESGYIYINGGNSSIQSRITNMERSYKYYRIARIISSLISSHPFVRSVMISGSLSKKNISRKDDIDFFIIAQPGRIWICRALLMLFKKIFLLNSRKYFCINYYIDTRSLEIPEKNIFTATELVFLVPLSNSDLYQKFLEANTWVRSFFPNFMFKPYNCVQTRDPFIKRLIEKMFTGKAGDKLDSYFMRLYINRTNKKYGNSSSFLNDINIKSEKNVAKFHPNGFQHLVLEKYAERISGFEMTNKIDLKI